MPQNQNNKNKIRGFSEKSKSEQKAEFAKAEKQSHDDPHYGHTELLNKDDQNDEKELEEK